MPICKDVVTGMTDLECCWSAGVTWRLWDARCTASRGAKKTNRAETEALDYQQASRELDTESTELVEAM